MLIPMVIFTNNSGLFYDNNIPGISHSLHTCTSATSCPADTSQGSCAHLIPTQDLGWAPKRDAQESPHLDATCPFWLVPTCPSATAELSALHPPKDSALLLTLELLTLQTPSEKWCLTLQTQKHSTKTFSWLSSPASPTSDPHGNLTIEQLLRGAREVLALPSLGAEHCPRSHTHNLGTWDWAKFCALGWLNLQKSSPKRAKLDKFCNICFKPFSFTSKSELIS